MYIEPFWVGVATTILVEVGMLLVIGIYGNIKK
jgi:hypothetical protein